jgi:hypothetical protein
VTAMSTNSEQAVRTLFRISARLQARGCDEAIAFLMALKERPDLAQIVTGTWNGSIDREVAQGKGA